MKRWHVWTEDHSRDDAAVMLAWSARDAACAFAESHGRIESDFAFEVFVSAVESQDVESQDVESFEFERQDAEPVQRDPLEFALSSADKRIASARAYLAEIESKAHRARSHLAACLLDRERWIALLARATSNDALRRQGLSDGETRRPEAAGE